jgi:hypothetical protein
MTRRLRDAIATVTVKSRARAAVCAAALLFATMLVGCERPEEAKRRLGADSVVVAAPMSGPEAIRRADLLESFVELNVRDTAYRFRAALRRNNGRVDTVALAAASIDDSSVAKLVDGAIVPTAVGQTRVRFPFSNRIELRGVVSISERIFSDSVWLGVGEVRAWELRPGWYHITVDAKAPPGQPQPLELAADLICVPDSRGPRETIVCRVRQNTRILLRHNGVSAREGKSVAVVTILHTPR